MFTPPGTPRRTIGGTPKAPGTRSAPSTPIRLRAPGTPGTPRTPNESLTASVMANAAAPIATTAAAPAPAQTPAPAAQAAAPAAERLDGAGLVVFQARPTGIHFLLVRSRHGTRQWSCPKGHLNAREAALACALRETEEETGLGQDALQLVSDFRRRIEIVLPRPTKAVPSGRKHVLFFLARARRNAPTKLSSEHSELQWASVAQAVRLLPAEQRELLDHAVRAARDSRD